MEQKESVLEKEIESLYRTYYQQLCLTAMRYVPAVDEARDIVQDFFINYWERRFQGIDAPDHFAAYARRAVRNLSIDFIRRQEAADRRQAAFGTVEDAVETEPFVEREESEAYQQRLSRIFELIDQLPPGQRAILRMHALDKLSYEQIATRQGVSINTVRTQLTRAYKSLRKSSSGILILSLLRYL